MAPFLDLNFLGIKSYAYMQNIKFASIWQSGILIRHSLTRVRVIPSCPFWNVIRRSITGSRPTGAPQLKFFTMKAFDGRNSFVRGYMPFLGCFRSNSDFKTSKQVNHGWACVETPPFASSPSPRSSIIPPRDSLTLHPDSWFPWTIWHTSPKRIYPACKGSLSKAPYE